MNTAIVVLGARCAADGSPSGAMRRRVDQALLQARGFPGIPVFFSGGDTGATLTEARVMASLARDGGLQPERIVLEETSRDTLGNARECLPLLRDWGIGRILLITDRPHMPRARLCFRVLSAGALEVLPRPCPWPALGAALTMATREAVALATYAPRLGAERRRMSLSSSTTNPEA